MQWIITTGLIVAFCFSVFAGAHAGGAKGSGGWLGEQSRKSGGVDVAARGRLTENRVETVTKAQATAYAKPILAKYAASNGSNKGYIFWDKVAEDLRRECAVLVQTIKQNGQVRTWKMGTDLKPDSSGGYPKIESGTAIATFISSRGTYPTNGVLNPKATGPSKWAHAAIFIGYSKDNKGEITGMYVLDQFSVEGGKTAGVSYKNFGATNPIYSVVK